MTVLLNSSPSVSAQSPQQYQFIDALRGWAILGVILVHTSQHFSPASTLLKQIAFNGQYGVQLFYLASAFTLFLSFASRKYEVNATLNFFIRRFFRIAPLFYCAVVFYLWQDGLGPSYWAPDGVKPWYVLSSLLFLNGWHPASVNSVVPGGWSVAVEMNFYLLVPILFRRVNTLHKAIGCTFAALILGLISGKLISEFYQLFLPASQQGLIYPFSTQYSLPAQASVFCLGFVLYFLFKRIEIPACRQKPESILWLMISLYLMAALLGGKFIIIPTHFMYGLSFLIFSYALALYPIRLFVNPALCFIGKVSYSTYLAQFAVIRFFDDHLSPFIPNQNDSGFIFAFIGVVLASVGVASLTFKFIEQPGQKMGRELILRLQARRKTPVN